MARTYITGKRVKEQEGKRVQQYRDAMVGSSDVSSGGSARVQPVTAPTPANPLPMKSKLVPNFNPSKPQSPLTALIGSDPATWNPSKTASAPLNYQPPKQQPGSYIPGDPGYANQETKNMKSLVMLAGLLVVVYFVFLNK